MFSYQVLDPLEFNFLRTLEVNCRQGRVEYLGPPPS